MAPVEELTREQSMQLQLHLEKYFTLLERKSYIPPINYNSRNSRVLTKFKDAKISRLKQDSMITKVKESWKIKLSEGKKQLFGSVTDIGFATGQ